MAAPPTDPPADAAHVRARDARAHYAPAEPRALGAMAALAVLAVLWLIVPVGLGVLVGALFAFTLYHPYRLLVRRTRRPVLVAAGATTAATVIVAGTLGVLLYLLVLQGVAFVDALPRTLGPGGTADVLVRRLARPLAVFGMQPNDVATRLRDASGQIAAFAAGWAAKIVAVVLNASLALFFMAITTFFVLRHWSALARRAEHLMPLNPHHTRHLLKEMHRLGRTVVVGNFGTALVQGTVAGAGYWIAGMPQPAFFGAITAVASLVPVVGTLVVWVPAGAALLLTGHAAAGLFELVWGAVAIVFVCDYFVRPRLVGRGERMSTWTTFVALFGGLELFGFAGFLLGPLIVGLALAALRLYERARRFRLGLS